MGTSKHRHTKETQTYGVGLVAQELGYGTTMDELYTSTPGLSCIKLAMIHAVEQNKNREVGESGHFR